MFRLVLFYTIIAFVVICGMMELAAYVDNYQYCSGGFFSFSDWYVTILTPLLSLCCGLLTWDIVHNSSSFHRRKL